MVISLADMKMTCILHGASLCTDRLIGQCTDLLNEIYLLGSCISLLPNKKGEKKVLIKLFSCLQEQCA